MGIRSALMLGGAAALPLAALAFAPQVATAHSKRFEAPAQPLVLTRELRRQLADGKEVVSRRSYEIRFVREKRGWRVDGALVASEVEAPPVLAGLAAIERARKDEGLFPLRLDENGMIVEQRGARDPASGSVARAHVDKAIERISLAPSDKQVARDMVRRIEAQASAAGGGWPADLFHPVMEPRSQVKSMALPDGSLGTVTVAEVARGSRDGLLEEFRRSVITELAGSRRENSEIWRLDAGR